MTEVEAGLRARIARKGALPFSAVMDAALYDPEGGFYATGGRAGRRGDFLTSPEVGPLFGAVVARALDAWWGDAGEPDRITVVEAGAGPGALARSVLAAEPACLTHGALRYVLVERSASQRDLHGPLLERHPDVVTSVADLPDAADRPEGFVVVLANELLDNLPVELAVRTGAGWSELSIDLTLKPNGRRDPKGRLVECLTPISGRWPAALSEDAPLGSRAPAQREAQVWLDRALALATADDGEGRVLLFDYASTTAELCARPIDTWLRTYRGHQRGGPPLEEMGTQDITCEVCVDQLASVALLTANRSQADWLRAHGIERLVAEGRRVWAERAHLGDLEAVRARSRITEAEALLDPDGLGAFRALEWA